MNEKLPLHPSWATCILISCHVEKLYPSVNNSLGIPAVKWFLEDNPSPSPLCNKACIISGYFFLENNALLKKKSDTVFGKVPGSEVFYSSRVMGWK